MGKIIIEVTTENVNFQSDGLSQFEIFGLLKYYQEKIMDKALRAVREEEKAKEK